MEIKGVRIGMIFLFVIILLSFVTSYSQSNVQFTQYQPSPGLFGYRSSLDFDDSMCEEGQDFLIQIAPFGCTPAVVRSDLLEEQNVPVFCQLAATKINPLIDVEAIESLSFKGDYPDEVAGVGFEPYRSALGGQGDLNNPTILENIGYAVIVLKKQPSEQEMPDEVEGTLGINIKYDIKNAFGIGRGSFYLPVLSDDEWEERKNQYSFWRGKGYLRAEDIEGTQAKIGVYDGSGRKVKSVVLDEGGTSEKIYLPGFYCLSSLELKLNDLQAPDTRALLRIDNDYVEVKQGERFLEDRCTVRSLYEAGILDTVEINCREDDSGGTLGFFASETHTLSVVPKIILSIDGQKREVELGEFLYEYTDDSKTYYVYLGYANSDTGAKEDLEIALISIPLETKPTGNKLDDNSIRFVSKLIDSYELNTGEGKVNLAKIVREVGQVTTGLISNAYANFVKGRAVTTIDYDGNVRVLGALEIADPLRGVYGKDISIVGFADPVDVNLEGTPDLSEARQNYDLAEQDFNSIIDDYALEKVEGLNKTYGEEAYEELIELNRALRQNRKVNQLCEDFKDNYGGSNLPGECSDITLSSSDVNSILVTINGKTRRITLDGIYEPNLDEYSADVNIKGPNGETRTITFGKGRSITLDDFRGRENQPFALDSGLIVEFDSNSKKWYWTKGNINDISVDQNVDDLEGAGLSVIEINFIYSLREKNFDEGRLIVLNELGYAESMELLDLEKESARFRISVAEKDITESIRDFVISDSRTLKLNQPQTFWSDYVFTLTRIRIEENAKVSVTPGIDNVGSEANFSFKIGIEKRGIQLSPSKTREMINSLNESIEKWTDISDKLENVITPLKKACVVGGVALTIKNFFANVGGKGIARQKIMRGEGGWYSICADKVSNKEFPSLEACYNANTDKINKDVEALYKIQQEQQKEIQKLQEGATKDGGILQDDVVNTTAFMKDYIPQVNSYVKDNNLNTFNYSGQQVDISSVLTPGIYNSQGTFTPEDARDIEANARLLKSDEASEEMKKAARKRLDSIYGRIYSNSQEYRNAEIISQANNIGLNKITYLKREGETVSAYTGLKGRDIKDPNINFGDDEPVQVVQVGGEVYYAGLNKPIGSDKYGISKVLDSNGKEFNLSSEPNHPLNNVVFQLSDESSYKNKGFKNPSIHFYETAPYEGLPAIVPFDTTNGWYAATRQTIPVFGGIQAYDKSGRVTSFYLCHVGSNGRQEFRSGIGDDTCQLINLGTGMAYNQFPGLSESEARKYINCGIQAIEQASRASKSGIVKVSTACGSVSVKVGEPAVNIPDIQCQDFMSPGDCRILYNLCDPVICPSSRCDLGGAYPVKDPIQTGIIGGLILCLPNFPQVFIPVCLTGVQAGVDGLVSVHTAYRDCLQEQLNTGKTIGICDEMHSVYLCELFWRQSLPLTDVLLSKLVGAFVGETGARGGGEYLGVRNALDTAGKSFSFFTQTYAENSFRLFRARSLGEVGTEICRSFLSADVPSMDFLNEFAEPDSPVQYHGRFSEIPFTTVTNPPISQYKVFYHIYAGKDAAAYYSVYLKGDPASSYYQDTSQPRTVAQGYIAAGDIATETRDFTAPSGYRQLCIRVNGQEECGFKEVSTSFALDYVRDQYIKEQATATNIQTESECISGSASAYSLLNPNLQEGAFEVANPSVYNYGLTRVCSTDNPGLGTDAKANANGSRWVNVGYCDDPNIRCWLDTSKINDITNIRTTEDEVLSELNQNTLELLEQHDNYLVPGEVDDKLKEIRESTPDDQEKIQKINELFGKIFFNQDRAKLYLERGRIYSSIAVEYFNKEFARIDEEGEEDRRLLTEDEWLRIQQAEKCEDCGTVGKYGCTEEICMGIGILLEIECEYISSPLSSISRAFGVDIGSCRLKEEEEVTEEEEEEPIPEEPEPIPEEEVTQVTPHIKLVFYEDVNDVIFVRWNFEINKPEVLPYPNGILQSSILNRQVWSSNPLSLSSFVSAGMYNTDISIINNMLTQSDSLNDFENWLVSALQISDAGIETPIITYTSNSREIDVRDYLDSQFSQKQEDIEIFDIGETQFKKLTYDPLDVPTSGIPPEYIPKDFPYCLRFDEQFSRKWKLSIGCEDDWPKEWTTSVDVESLDVADFEKGFLYLTYLTEYEAENVSFEGVKQIEIKDGNKIYYFGDYTNLYLYEIELGDAYRVYNEESFIFDGWNPDTIVGLFQRNEEGEYEFRSGVSAGNSIYDSKPEVFKLLNENNLIVSPTGVLSFSQ